MFRSATDLEEIPEEFNGSAAFEAYFEAAATAAFSKDELAVYIKDMTTKWDIELAMKEHLEKGRKEGRAEGREDAIVEMAKKMLGLGLSSEIIASTTGLTPEQIEAL